jgi:AcrR family transcriptional regulator
VTAAQPAAGPRADQYTAAQRRIVDAAVELFAEHGIGGTSLQMIADEIGVTKAAVYHQYRTKDEIVLAVAEANLPQLEAILDEAEAEPDPEQAREALLPRLVDMAVEHRRIVNIQNDPVMIRVLNGHAVYLQQMERMHRLLAGGDPTRDDAIAAALLSAGIASAASHPLVADVDDETLRENLLQVARRNLQLP